MHYSLYRKKWVPIFPFTGLVQSIFLNIVHDLFKFRACIQGLYYRHWSIRVKRSYYYYIKKYRLKQACKRTYRQVPISFTTDYSACSFVLIQFSGNFNFFLYISIILIPDLIIRRNEGDAAFALAAQCLDAGDLVKTAHLENNSDKKVGGKRYHLSDQSEEIIGR